MPKIVPPLKSFFLALVPAAVFLLIVGCPHRSPVWSPDSKHILLLSREAGQTAEESVDHPAGGLWLVATEARKAARLSDPAPRVRYLSAFWIDEKTFAAFTAVSEGGPGEVKEGSEAMWRREVGGKDWARIPGPNPSAERTPRRNPLALKTGGRTLLVYATGHEAVVAVDAADGKELFRLEPAELVGPGPGNGFLATRPEGQTGGLELVAVGESLKPLWTKRFSALAGEISSKLGKKSVEIVINDTSTSARLGAAPDSEVAVTFVYTEVSWKEGISGYFVRFDGKDGRILAAVSATAMPGRPGEAAGAAWAITPAGRGDLPALRSFPLGGGADGVRLELEGLKKSAIHGYSLSPTGKEFGAVITGPRVKLLLFPIEGSKVSGKPAEIEIGA